jgi:hypothetical protein
MDFGAIIKNNHWSDLLLNLGTYEENQYQFALSHTYQQFWETCPRGEWLLHWIAQEESTPHKQIVYAACQCARLALPYCEDKQQRPLKAIETTEKWIRGEATIEEVKQAREAVYAAATSTASTAYAACHAASAAYYAADTAVSFPYAAASAAYYAASNNQGAARQAMQLQTADIVRSLIPRPDKLVDEYQRILELKAFL